jgi:ketosteroid isomerase-like protein
VIKNALAAILWLVFLGAANVAVAQADAGKEVLALEYQWLKADQTNNADMAAALLADDYVSTGADGALASKADTIGDARARKYSSASYEDVKAHVSGSTVVVTGGYRGKGTDPEGKPFDEHLRWTDTWVRNAAGKWQCVASQYTAVK